MRAADTEDWRRKYLDSLRTLERDEHRFRDQLQSVYKLVGRLCLAAQGQSPRLDQQLNRLKESVRKGVEPEQLEPLGLAISEAVLEIDKGASTLTGIKPVGEKPDAPPPAAPSPPAAVPVVTAAVVPAVQPAPVQVSVLIGEERIRALLLRLLDEVDQDERLRAAADPLRRDLAVALVPDQLAAVIERIGGLVVQRIRGLERLRQEMELLLGQLVSQLDSMTRYVSSSAEEASQRSSSSEALNVQITGEIRALDASVSGGSDLAVIRRQLRERLDAIERHMQDFRAREEERAQAVRERTEQMRGRMNELETEASKLKARLTDEIRLSMRDPLTQIPNRMAYEQRIGEEMERWARFAQPTCIMVCDIDKFKGINDQYGHRAGDKVLTVVAECLANSIRSTDFVARYGGEEFVLLLPGTALPDALLLVEEMRAAIMQLGFHFRNAPVSITVSCGLTAFKEGDTVGGAFDRADKAMYRAKEAGRNRVVSV